MNNFTVKELITNTTAFFLRFRMGNLWYGIEYSDGSVASFEFPVPIEDVGDATFHEQEPGIYMMRYIRKHLEDIEAGQDVPA